jgi:hypothetical protein
MLRPRPMVYPASKGGMHSRRYVGAVMMSNKIPHLSLLFFISYFFLCYVSKYKKKYSAMCMVVKKPNIDRCHHYPTCGIGSKPTTCVKKTRSCSNLILPMASIAELSYIFHVCLNFQLALCWTLRAFTSKI